MNKVILNGEDFTTKEELHSILKSKLELPDYYGNNLDALRDCLTGWIEVPMTLEWINFEKSKNNLGDYVQKLLEVFKEAQEEINGFILIIK
ncbi:barnase inhibitor [Clostridium baratii]|uniref:Barnase inhibitor n=1 Tax=Clostridium baratii TaxID=1561 RepID=A0A174RU11_9CLOT|nr:barstar family protein [Clostridium baratii]OPF51156.1 barnase inhibitor [Clostridium baratii]OPF55767.1 barnase inhibitor [Clostridium baratii]OPF56853.1 barnase inhibitor [Clostridium baratii]OPF59852.1 barnase inhibitor [Clostridium baratii]CUP87177.1 barnase inhibitor [Clostridium baratii]